MAPITNSIQMAHPPRWMILALAGLPLLLLPRPALATSQSPLPKIVILAEEVDQADAEPTPVRNLVKPNAPLEPLPETETAAVTSPSGNPQAVKPPIEALENPSVNAESAAAKGDSFSIKSEPAAPQSALTNEIEVDRDKVPKELPAKKTQSENATELGQPAPSREEASVRLVEEPKVAPEPPLKSAAEPVLTPAVNLSVEPAVKPPPTANPLLIKYPQLTKKQWAKMTKKQKAKYLKSQKAEQKAHAKIRKAERRARQNAPDQTPTRNQLADENIEDADPLPEREPAEDDDVVTFKDTIVSIVDFNEQWEVNFAKKGRYKIRGQPTELFDYQQTGQFLEVQALDGERRILSIKPTKVRFRPIR